MEKQHIYMVDRGPEEGLEYIDKEKYDHLKSVGVDEDRLIHRYSYRNDDVEALITASRDASSVLSVVKDWLKVSMIDSVSAKLIDALRGRP